MAYRFIWEDEGVVCVIEGGLTNKAVLANEELYSNPRFPRLKYVILNLLAVTEFTIDSESIRKLAQQDAAFYRINPKVKVAVVSSKIVMKGLTNMYQIYLQLADESIKNETKYFDTLEGAIGWVSP